MVGRRREIPRLQSDFYRDKFRQMLRLLMLSSIIMLLLLVVVFYLILSKPGIDYYANTTSGKILDMPKPLSS